MDVSFRLLNTKWTMALDSAPTAEGAQAIAHLFSAFLLSAGNDATALITRCTCFGVIAAVLHFHSTFGTELR